MGSFDQGYAGMTSLKAVNEWIGIINSNLGGSNRTAYKATKVSFGGGVVTIEKDPRPELNGIQVPDSTLNINHTRTDFSQGTIVQDGELTHLAISGEGFFAVHDGTTTYYTRDGEFRWSVLNGQTILTTASGLTVLGGSSPSTTAYVGAGQALTYGVPILRYGTGSSFAVTLSSVTGASANVAIYRFSNSQALKFSRFGSTVFDASSAVGANHIAGREQILSGTVDVTQSALEASNAALNDTLPELSLAQKLFSAVSKIINVNNSNLDTVVNLIR